MTLHHLQTNDKVIVNIMYPGLPDKQHEGTVVAVSKTRITVRWIKGDMTHRTQFSRTSGVEIGYAKKWWPRFIRPVQPRETP